MDLSLPQIIDLTTHQRKRAERALSVARRHLTAQEQKVKRMHSFLERLPEVMASQEAADDSQLDKHQKAARQEYEKAVEAMEKLRARRKKLREKVQEKIEIERTMETLSTSTAALPRDSEPSHSRMTRHSPPSNVIPITTSRAEGS